MISHEAINHLRSRLKGDVYDDSSTLDKTSRDTSLFRVKPELVVAPQDVADIKALVAFANEEHSAGRPLALTARSAGTDMTGGPLNEGVIVDFTKYFIHMGAVTGDHVVTEPGVYYRDFDKVTLQKNRILPSFPASREMCTVGGMVANNSGGEKTLVYGKTDRYVKQINVVLSDGNEYVVQPLSLEELKQKENIQGFGGEMYKKLHMLIEENYDLLENARPQTSKNSSGYALWDILDKKRGVFDLTKLFVGSQGTLGFITKITFKLVKPYKHSRLLVIFLRDMNNLGTLVNKVVSFKPESFESYDDHTFHVAMKLFPQIVRRLGGNIFKLAFAFIPEFFAVITGGVPKLVLLAEFTAKTDAEALQKAKEAKLGVAEFHGLKARITKNEREAEKYWVVRRESFNLLRQKTKHMRTAPFIDDLIVRPAVLPEFLPKLYEILDTYPLTYTIAGHMGDANFHIIPLMDIAHSGSKAMITEIMEKVQRLVWSYHGSNTAEHNDGLLRSSYLPDMYGAEVYSLFEQTKNILDPKNIFNPGKKVGASHTYAWEHIDDDL
ncbi:MAG TPA: FAD-binding oxidoreductase [Candidatus Paceibacterota bacterium]